MKRVAYTPKEFGELFGKSQTWGYRQIQKGKVNAIKDYGRIMIPAEEVDRVLQSAGRYLGISQPLGKARKFEKEAKEEKLKRFGIRKVWKRKAVHLKRKGASSHAHARKRLIF